MTADVQNVFADSLFWIALVVRQDQHHDRAQQWSLRITGRVTTTAAVLLETANALARPTWRAHGIALIDHLLQRADVEIVEIRPGMTDCISFIVMQDA